METNADGCHAKKTKILLCISLIMFAALLICMIGTLIYFSPLVATYKVEYIKDSDDTLVQMYYKGEKIYFPEQPSRSGYTFIGWSFDKEENYWVTTELVVDKELTLYAKWEEKTFNLNFADKDYKINYACGLKVVDNVITFVNLEGDSVTLLPKEKEGYTFNGWELSDDKNTYSLKNIDFDNFQSNNLYLREIYIPNKVNFNIQTSSDYTVNILTNSSYAMVGENVVFELKLNENVSNSQVQFVTSSGKITSTYDSVNKEYLVEVSNYIADFEVSIKNVSINTYNVNFVSDDEKISSVFNYGDNLILPNISKTGYNLIGFVDIDGAFYTNDFVVCEDLELYAVWEIKSFSISFPKSNGMYTIKCNDQIYASNKIISKNYSESLDFEVQLSSAYSFSELNVYALCGSQKIIPNIRNNKYYFDFISSDMEIVIDGVTLNNYHVIVDDISYGNVAYGSLISLNDNNITITDYYNNNIITIETLIADEHFEGWLVNNSILVNCSIQEIANSKNIVIYGQYSKDFYKIHLDTNGASIDDYDIIIVEGEDFTLPTLTKEGYTFVGWFVELVEKNTVADLELSKPFENLTSNIMTLYAGFTK